MIVKLSKFINKKKELLFLAIILSFSIYCSLIVGMSWDEPYHYRNGENIYKYIFSFGKLSYESANFPFHFGFYDFFSTLITKNFSSKYIIESHHLINLSFSLGTVFGIYKLSKFFFNKEIAKLSFIFLFFNPIFFGHFSINSKDTIVAFSHVWFFYILIKYFENLNNNLKRTNLVFLLAFIFSLGLSIRLTFIFSLFPIFIILILDFLIFRIFLKKISFQKSILFDLLIFFLISVSITLLFWPDTHKDIFSLPFVFVKNYFNNFFSSSFSLPFGILNGHIYSTSNTPNSYIFIMLLYKMPTYIILAFFLLPFFYFLKNFWKKKIFLIKFLYISMQFLIPLILVFSFSVSLNDGIRYFLYIIPYIVLFFCILLYLIFSYKKIYLLPLKFFFICLFLFEIYIFFILTPYQYSYINFLNGKYSENIHKFENDYWGISLKELILDINKKKLFLNERDKIYKVAFCGLNEKVAQYYLNKLDNFKYRTVDTNKDYDFIVFINRNTGTANQSIDDVSTCYKKFFKEQLLTVDRNNLSLSFISK